MKETVIAIAILILIASAAIASEPKCVKVDGIKYCQTIDEIKLGGVAIKVKDPLELLRKAKETSGNLKRTGLYDDYHYLPIVQELAKQNDMKYDEFVTYMIKHWKSKTSNPFKILREFEEIYDTLPHEYKEVTLVKIADLIVHDINNLIDKVFLLHTEA